MVNYLDYAVNQQIENERMKKMLEERQFPEEYTNSLFNINETTSNLDMDSEYTAFQSKIKNFLVMV